MKTLLNTVLIFCLLLAVLPARAEVVYGTQLRLQEVGIGNILKWTTLTESKSSAFEIQRCIEGDVWVSIGRVKASGYSEKELTYNFLDIDTRYRAVKYRLRQLDMDGVSKESNVIYHRQAKIKKLLITDMAVADVVNTADLQINAFNSGLLKWTIKRIDGTPVTNGQKRIESGIQELSFDTRALTSGIYMLSVDLDGDVIDINFMKNRMDTITTVFSD